MNLALLFSRLVVKNNLKGMTVSRSKKKEDLYINKQ